jgi:hypothetical protein
MKQCVVIFSLLICAVSYSNQLEVPDTQQKTDKTLIEQASDKLEETKKNYDEEVDLMAERRRRSAFTFLGEYAPIGTWIPGKFGISLNYIRNSNWSFELEGLYGSINYELLGVKLSSFKETRLSLLARYFPSSSFNLFFGIHHENLELVLGDALVAGLSGVDVSEYRLLQLSNLGIGLGLGNRWYFENGFTVGIDWLAINQPIIPLKTESKFLSSNANQSDKDAVDKGLTALKLLPRLTLIKVALGWTF